MSIAKKFIRSGSTMMLSSYVNVLFSFVGNLFLARILVPDVFGVYALASSILSFVFVLGGFGSQEIIIQNRDESLDNLIPTAFWISFGIAVGLAIIGSLISFCLVDVYSAPIPSLILLLSWLQCFQAIGGTYSAILQRDLNFNIIAWLRMAATLTSFGLAVATAFWGVGVWALLIRQATLTIITMVGMIMACHYSLTFNFNITAARTVWNFGWRLMVSRISEVVFGQFDNLIVGSLLGTPILGHYTFAYRLNLLGHQFTQSAIQPVVLSVFSALQSSPRHLVYGSNRLLFWLVRIACLLSVIVFVLGYSLVVTIYGSDWSLAGTIFQNMALFLGLMPVHEGVRQILIATGQVGNVMRSQMYMLAIYVPALMIGASIGNILIVAWVVNMSLLLSTALLLYYVSRRIDLSWYYLFRNPIIASLFTIVIAQLAQSYIVITNPLVFIVVIGLLVVFTYIMLLTMLEIRVLRNETASIWDRFKEKNYNPSE